MEGENRNNISSDQYFMGIAKLAGLQSSDPGSQVGICMVGEDNEILAVGCYGTPADEPDDFSDLHREIEQFHCAAESETPDIRMYTSMFPNTECARVILEGGVRLVIYDGETHTNSLSEIVSKRALRLAGVVCQPYEKSGKMIDLAV